MTRGSCIRFLMSEVEENPRQGDGQMSLHYLYLDVYFILFLFLNKPGTPFAPICFFSPVRSWTICPLNLPLSSLTANNSSNPRLNVIVRPQQRPSNVVDMVNVAWSFLGASILLGTSGKQPVFFVRSLLTCFLGNIQANVLSLVTVQNSSRVSTTCANMLRQSTLINKS